MLNIQAWLSLFFFLQNANMILVSMLAALMFLGGWLSPVSFIPDGILWLFLKVGFCLFFFLWFRATFPRYRYDQLMKLGWKVFLPLSLAWVIFVAGTLVTFDLLP